MQHMTLYRVQFNLPYMSAIMKSCQIYLFTFGMFFMVYVTENLCIYTNINKHPGCTRSGISLTTTTTKHTQLQGLEIIIKMDTTNGEFVYISTMHAC